MVLVWPNVCDAGPTLHQTLGCQKFIVGTLCHFSVHAGPVQGNLPPEHRMRNSSRGGLRSSTLPLCHGCSLQCRIFTSERGRINLFLLKVIYHPLYSMNQFVTNKSKLPQDGAQVFPYMG